MAREYFCTYHSYLAAIEPLNDEERGRLFTALLTYSQTGTAPDLPGNERFVFPTMREQMDRDQKKYQAKCERNRINGAKGGKANATERYRTPPKAKAKEKAKAKAKEKENIEGVPGGTPADKPPRSRFIPPTVEEVKAYCQERRNDVDPQRFVDFYETKGWMVGKNKMKDWRAAVRTWEKRDGGSNQQKGEEDAGKYAGLVV